MASLTSVHPRSRGDHVCFIFFPSPRNRFTPAHAGIIIPCCLSQCGTSGSPPLTRGSWPVTISPARLRAVHPRSRGDHEHGGFRTYGCKTVHPRSRGDHNCVHLLIDCVNRFTPAHAGIMSSRGWTMVIDTVHPRSRGDHVRDFLSPVERFRFTPAHAGIIVSQGQSFGIFPVHPRSRGDHESTMFCAEWIILDYADRPNG